jgi:uncharacterized membrane protein HdeD (DUF308 family)
MVRIVQIVLGLVILFLSIMVLINPILGTASVISFIAILLLFAGIEKVISGFVIPGKYRFISMGLGIIVIIISLIAMAYPEGASVFVILLLASALLVEGVSRIIHGILDKKSKGWLKGFGIGVGIFSIIFATIIMVRPGIGLAIAGILIGISLLATSLQIISAGITGKPRKKDTLLK